MGIILSFLTCVFGDSVEQRVSLEFLDLRQFSLIFWESNTRNIFFFLNNFDSISGEAKRVLLR